MSCLLMRVTLISAAAAVIGAIDAPASVAVVPQDVSVQAEAECLVSAHVAVNTGQRLHFTSEIVTDGEEDHNLTIEASLENVIPSASATMMNASPSAAVTLMNDVGLSASIESDAIDVGISEVCMVGNEEMTVLSASDQLLYYADGGYVRLNPEE